MFSTLSQFCISKRTPFTSVYKRMSLATRVAMFTHSPDCHFMGMQLKNPITNSAKTSALPLPVRLPASISQRYVYFSRYTKFHPKCSTKECNHQTGHIRLSPMPRYIAMLYIVVSVSIKRYINYSQEKFCLIKTLAQFRVRLPFFSLLVQQQMLLFPITCSVLSIIFT